jgi:hypothetical protein
MIRVILCREMNSAEGMSCGKTIQRLSYIPTRSRGSISAILFESSMNAGGASFLMGMESR